MTNPKRTLADRIRMETACVGCDAPETVLRPPNSEGRHTRSVYICDGCEDVASWVERKPA